MHVVLSKFLEDAGCSVRLLRPFFLRNSFNGLSSIFVLKPLLSTKLPWLLVHFEPIRFKKLQKYFCICYKKTLKTISFNLCESQQIFTRYYIGVLYIDISKN